jgi:hypothetical protein
MVDVAGQTLIMEGDLFLGGTNFEVGGPSFFGMN